MTNGIAFCRGILLGLAAAVVLAACVAHGQQPQSDMPRLSEPPRVTLPTLTKHPYWRVYRSYSSHSSAFFKRLLFGRVFVHRYDRGGGRFVIAELIREDGTMSLCFPSNRNGREYFFGHGQIDIETHSTGASRTVKWQGQVGHSLMFYVQDTGTLRLEHLLPHRDPNRRRWEVFRSGWVQDSWPRAMADACPKIKLPAGMRINEKQTSRELNKLRRQDPDAPIRHFPGSEHTAPGRTGVVATGGGATTTLEDIEAFMRAQAGNIMLSSYEKGYVFTPGWSEGTTEIWRLAPIGEIIGFGTNKRIEDSTGQLWSISDIPLVGKVHYPIGWPLPLLPTGYRHAAFQLTDRLVEAGEPVALPWMPEKWKDFLFLADGKVRARRADGGPDRMGRWLWTEARLWVDIDGNSKAPGWEEVAEALGMEKPKLWTLADGQRIGPQASAAPATSGTGKCVGKYTGTATWTLDANGAKVWDTSGCRPKQEG